MRRDGVWRKSSRSGGEGNCVEVAAFAAPAGARNSAVGTGDGVVSARDGAVGTGDGAVGAWEGVVGVRDSKDRPGPALSFDSAAWARFVAAVPAGERDHQL